MKTIVITGASSGIGEASVKHFLANNWKVAATMRNVKDANSDFAVNPNVSLHSLDVTSIASIENARTEILETHRTVHAVLNNAGYALSGPFESVSNEQIEAQFATNVFGLMNVTRAFLQHFKQNNEGVFINVSSLGGRITYPLTSLYHSTKWAIEGFSESLSFELKQFNIQVKLIEPGAVSTNFSGRSMQFGRQEDAVDYGTLIQKFTENLKQSDRIPVSADEVAMEVFKATTDLSDRLRYPVGDAERMIKMRIEIGEENFIKNIGKKMLS